MKPRSVSILSLDKLPATRFTLDNSGGHHSIAYPWSLDFKRGTLASFTKRLTKGWRVRGWAVNSDLALGPRRYEDHRQRWIAVMFTDPDGFDFFFHLDAAHPHVFVET